MSSLHNSETDSSAVSESITFSVFEQKLFQSIPIIEEVMDWYDHIACIFLLYDNPTVALEHIQSVLTAFKEESDDSWRHLFLSQFQNYTNQDKYTSALRLVEVLHILQHHKLLSVLETSVKSINIVDSFRLKLFRVIDTLSEDHAAALVKCMNLHVVEANHKHLCLEIHFLEWIRNGVISVEDCSKLDNSLAYIRNLSNNSTSKKLLSTSETVDSVHGDTTTYNTSIIPSIAPSNSTNLTEEIPSKIKVSNGLCIIINQENFYFDGSLPSEMLKVFISHMIL